MARQFLVPLLLPANPTAPMQAATKQYVDAIADEIYIGPTAPADTTQIWFDTSQVGIEENARYFASVTTTTYSFVLSDRGKMIEFDNAATQTATVQPDATANFVVGTQIDMIQFGVGQLVVAAGAGVTLRATPGLSMRARYSSATLLKRAVNDWYLVGDLV